MADSRYTYTLQNIINYALTKVELLPIAGLGGITNEPALSICNDTIQEILGEPYDWKFNRTEMTPFVLRAGQEDYLFAGGAAFTLGSTAQGAAIDLQSNNAITESGNVVTVKTLEPHGFSVGDVVYLINVFASDGTTASAYTATLTVSASSGSIWSGGFPITAVTSKTFQFAGSTSETTGSNGINNWGWGTSATIVDVLDTSIVRKTRQLQVVKELTPTSDAQAWPKKICMLQDKGTGVLKFRLREVPNYPWLVNLVYQAKAPVKADLTRLWDPIPDEYSYVYRQGVMAKAYDAVGSQKFQVEYEKFQTQIRKALGEADREEDDIYVTPAESLMGSDFSGFSF